MASISSDFVRARRLAIASVVASAALSALNIVTGMLAGSTAVLAVGLEFAGDVLASLVVLVGLRVAARPPDENHPYGHGRVETLAGLIVGFILMAGGAAIAVRSFQAVSSPGHVPAASALWVLVLAIAVRGALSAAKFRMGRRMSSTSLVADARSDAVDILSALVALGAVGLTRLDPARFLRADAYGGVAVGLAVVLTGLRVVREAAFALADTMPDPVLTESLRRVAMSVSGVLGIEKHHARKTGLQYHVDLHVEVDPQLSVRASHQIAHQVKRTVLAELPWVADVLVHVEPADDDDDGKAFSDGQ